MKNPTICKVVAAALTVGAIASPVSAMDFPDEPPKGEALGVIKHVIENQSIGVGERRVQIYVELRSRSKIGYPAKEIEMSDIDTTVKYATCNKHEAHDYFPYSVVLYHKTGPRTRYLDENMDGKNHEKEEISRSTALSADYPGCPEGELI